MGEPTLKWQTVNTDGSCVQRARIPGGWLVMVVEMQMEYWPNGEQRGNSYLPALTFVPLAAWPEEQGDG